MTVTKVVLGKSYSGSLNETSNSVLNAGKYFARRQHSQSAVKDLVIGFHSIQFLKFIYMIERTHLGMQQQIMTFQIELS